MTDETKDPQMQSLSSRDQTRVLETLADIIERDTITPGYAVAVARGIASHLRQPHVDLPGVEHS